MLTTTAAAARFAPLPLGVAHGVQESLWYRVTLFLHFLHFSFNASSRDDDRVACPTNAFCI